MTNEQRDSGPAFPSHGSMGEVAHEGMTLRDYFAAKALPAVIDKCAGDTRKPGESHATYFAAKCYELADAMLKAREA